jgi:hypothetical protein
MNKSKVVARLTITRADNSRKIIEVHEDATFHEFFRFYTQIGNRRSTKTLTFTSSRITGLKPINAHRYTPGLEVIRDRVIERSALLIGTKTGKFSPVISMKLRIIKRKAYRRLITIAPDQLGLTKIITTDLNQPRRPIAVAVPSYRLVAKINDRKLHAGLVR